MKRDSSKKDIPSASKKRQLTASHRPINVANQLSAKQRLANDFFKTNGWILYPFQRDDQRFLSNRSNQTVMESETFGGFCGDERVSEGEDVPEEYAQRVPRPNYIPNQVRTPYREIEKAWKASNKKEFILPPGGYKTKRTGHGWVAISLDRDRDNGSHPSREHLTKMVRFGNAVQRSKTEHTLLEEGIESVINQILQKHMGKRAFVQLKKQQAGHALQSHHLATPQIGSMPVSQHWIPREINCPTMENMVMTKIITTTTSKQTLRDALGLYLAQEIHRDYVDSSCAVGCMTVLVTTACPARIAIVQNSHNMKNGAAFVTAVQHDPCEHMYVIIEIPPYSLLIMDSYLFHAGCRYFMDDHCKRQGTQIGPQISYRSHHYIIPDSQVDPSNETGVKWKWW